MFKAVPLLSTIRESGTAALGLRTGMHMGGLRFAALAATAAISLNASAVIADGMPSRGPDPYPYAPPGEVSLVYDWTGIYGGGHLGVATSLMKWNLLPGVPDEHEGNDTGFVGGGFAGVQKQWSWLVFGAEVAYLWTGQSDVSTTVFPDTTFSGNVHNLLLVTGKLGWAHNRSLAYFKGGWASADVNFRTSVTSTGATISSTSGRENGWTAGAGLEYALWPHVIIGVEYDYVRIGGQRPTQIVSPLGPVGSNVSWSADLQSVTARLSFKFGGHHQ
jgi:outer membrane immunogenic protein